MSNRLKILALRPATICLFILLLQTCVIDSYANGSGLVDPTRPDYYTGSDSSFIQQLKKRYKLSSIIVSEQRRTAVINGIYVKEGQQIGEGVVRKIDSFNVIIEAQGARFKVALSDNNFKKRQNKR